MLDADLITIGFTLSVTIYAGIHLVVWGVTSILRLI